MTKWQRWRFRVLMGGMRDVIFAVDGLRLWFRPRWARAVTADGVWVGHRAVSRVRPRGGTLAWVVILPGIGDRTAYWAGVQGWLAERGVGSVVVGYSGYPGSGGRTTPEELEEDGRAVYGWVRQQEEAPVFLLGFSLGSGIAAAIAGGLAPEPAGLILCSGYTTLRAAARRVVRVPGLERLLPNVWDSVAALQGLKLPVLVVHSAGDWLFPVWMGEELGRSGEFCRLEGLSHNAAHAEVPESYWGAVVGFMARQRGASGGGSNGRLKR